MPRCVIFCAGERGSTRFTPRADDLTICCDGGYTAAREMGIVPDLLLGDFDSLTEPRPAEIETQVFPSEKDDTDSMLAARAGLARGYRTFVLLFSLGGRLDHTIANLRTLEFLLDAGASGLLVGPRDTVRLLRNSSLTLPRRAGYTLSVFAYGDAAQGVTLAGVKYPLTDATLATNFPLGLGNEILADAAVISVSSGTLLIVCSAL